MKQFRWYNTLIILSLFIIISSCGKPLPDLEGIDLNTWKGDKNACQNKRSAMTAPLKAQKNKLLALDQMQIVDLLGRPDQNELYKRNQKFFYYFLQPSKDCQTSSPSPLRLVLRFNAMGLVKEVAIE